MVVVNLVQPMASKGKKPIVVDQEVEEPQEEEEEEEVCPSPSLSLSHSHARARARVISLDRESIQGCFEHNTS